MFAPLAERVAENPTQMAVGLTEELTVGFGTTVRLMVFEPRQPAALAPMTVYTCVAAGDTTVDEPVMAPGFQV